MAIIMKPTQRLQTLIPQSARRLVLGVTLCCAALSATAAGLEVKNPWVRSTVPAQKITGAYMELRSEQDAVLLSVTSPVAGATEIHATRMEGGIMKMRPVKKISLPAGKAVALAPGGHHVMLLDLKRPLAAGEKVPLTLRFEDKSGKPESVEVSAEVRDITAAAGHGMH